MPIRASPLNPWAWPGQAEECLLGVQSKASGKQLWFQFAYSPFPSPRLVLAQVGGFHMLLHVWLGGLRAGARARWALAPCRGTSCSSVGWGVVCLRGCVGLLRACVLCGVWVVCVGVLAP